VVLSDAAAKAGQVLLWLSRRDLYFALMRLQGKKTHTPRTSFPIDDRSLPIAAQSGHGAGMTP
jgi:hypothetical protein